MSFRRRQDFPLARTVQAKDKRHSTRLLNCCRGILVLLLLAAASARAADEPELPAELTLSEAIRIALTNNSALRAAQARLEQATGRYQQARSTLLPQLDIVGYQSYLTINLQGLGIEVPGVPNSTKEGPFGSFDVRARLRQDLINIANLQSWKSSRKREDSTRLQVDNVREVLTLDVVATYLEALRARATRNAVTEQTKLALDLVKITEDRVKQGVSAPLDANRATQQVNSLEQQRQEAEHSYIAAKLALAGLLQRRITADFEVADEAAYGTGAPVDRQAAVSSALASRPDYRAALVNVQAAELQIRAVKAQHIPVLGTNLSDGQSGNSPVNNVNTYRLTATLSVPIFTGGRIQGEIVEAKGALQEAQAAVDQLRSQIETEVLSALSGVEWAIQEVETSRANVSLSREELKLTRQKFLVGVTDNTEIVNAQDRISRADDAYVRAQYTLGLARANLARATGAAEKAYRK